MTITSHEFQGMARSQKGKGKTKSPSEKGAKVNKVMRSQLVPYQSPQRRAGLAGA